MIRRSAAVRSVAERVGFLAIKSVWAVGKVVKGKIVKD